MSKRMVYKPNGSSIKAFGQLFDYLIIDEDADLPTGYFERPKDAIEQAIDDADTNDNGYLSVKEIKAKLDELGVEYNPKSNRKRLLSLLESI